VCQKKRYHNNIRVEFPNNKCARQTLCEDFI